MELSDLQIFLAVAQEQSITRAAQALDRVPSNVTTRIQQLEESLGTALFVRENKRMVPSAAGVTLVSYATQLLNLAQEARQAVQSTEPGGRLRLGSMESSAASRLPQPLARLHQQWPELEIQLRTGTTRFLADAVLSHALDCAVVAHPSPERSDDMSALGAGLEGHYLFTEDLVLVLPEGNPDPLPRALATFARGCAYRERAEQWLRAEGVDMARCQTLELVSYHALLACVLAGSAMAVVPRSVLALHPAGSRLPVREIGPAHCFLIHRKGHDSANTRALLAVLQS